MFQIAANPKFEANLKIVGQGREQTLKLTFKHKTRKQYSELLDRIREGKVDIEDAVLEIVDEWDADLPLSKESLAELRNQQPGADWAIITGFGDALVVAREGN